MTAPSDTVVGPARGELVVVRAGFPALGALAGWLLGALAGWWTSLRWLPLRVPLEWLVSRPEPAATLGAVGVGAAAGLFVALLAENDYVRVRIGDHQVTVTRARLRRTVPRAAVRAGFLDRKQLVLLGHRGEELVRVAGDVPAGARLAAAFHDRGYRWLPGGDPYRDEYRRWVPDMAGLPPGAGALLAARSRALGRGDRDDAAQLHAELARLGVVVRDENKRQYWRTVPAG